MGVEEELARLSHEKNMLLTIGVFDGVHLGHKCLVAQLGEQAKQQGLISGVVTFRQHPREVLSPQTGLLCLTLLDERIRLLKVEGVDEIIALAFTHELVELSASQFISLLQKHLRMSGLVIGPGFALGRDREGDADTLRKLGEDMNFSLTVVSPIIINGEVVSSTAIRSALTSGDMGRVYDLMGRYFSLRGRVITGAARGVELGFPTANIDVDTQQALPSDGVYATLVSVGAQTYQSVTNIGKRPTFNDRGRTVEVYILDYHGDLYGDELKIDIVERLRGEKKFGTVEELKRQVTEDVKQGKVILNSRGRS